MKITETALPGVFLIENRVYRDDRGLFAEFWREESLAAGGLDTAFVQDSISVSRQSVVRGLHYQSPPKEQVKLVTVLQGTIFDVTVDIRASSPTFGRWVGFTLSADRLQQVYIPQGFAHGYCALSPEAMISYKMGNYYDPACESGIRWNDPDIGIAWPVREPILSPRDAAFPLLRDMCGR